MEDYNKEATLEEIIKPLEKYNIRKFEKNLTNEQKIETIIDIATYFRNDYMLQGRRFSGYLHLSNWLAKIYKLEVGEVFKRPLYTMQSFGDCDDQTIVMLSALKFMIPDRNQLRNYKIITMGIEREEHITQIINDKIVDCLPYKFPYGIKIYQERNILESEIDKIYE